MRKVITAALLALTCVAAQAQSWKITVYRNGQLDSQIDMAMSTREQCKIYSQNVVKTLAGSEDEFNVICDQRVAYSLNIVSFGVADTTPVLYRFKHKSVCENVSRESKKHGEVMFYVDCDAVLKRKSGGLL